MRIVTEYRPVSGHIRDYDWSAYDADKYDVDCGPDGYFSTSPIGYGRTEQAAIDDLLSILACE